MPPVTGYVGHVADIKEAASLVEMKRPKVVRHRRQIDPGFTQMSRLVDE